MLVICKEDQSSFIVGWSHLTLESAVVCSTMSFICKPFFTHSKVNVLNIEQSDVYGHSIDPVVHS